jgi:glycerol-3-phosphate dehydrogenase
VPNVTDRFDVAIVGGGIAGLAVAWQAQQRGLRTVVLERDAFASGATRVAAARERCRSGRSRSAKTSL